MHFACLFRDTVAADLFDLICVELGVETDENDEKIIHQLSELVENPEEWGNEALKWFIGSKSLKIATNSLAVYNHIPKPPLDVKLMASSVLFHVRHSQSECSELVLESFVFLANNFTGNEEFAAQYLLSFLDSALYSQTSVQLLLKLLPSRVPTTQTWPSIIPIIKPMISRLERNESIQKLFDLFIKTSHNEELMLIVAPLKQTDRSLFPSSTVAADILKSASEATLCKCLCHYANMVSTASVRLQDSILAIVTAILNKIGKQDNNRVYLSKFYTIALNSLAQCPSAFNFLGLILTIDPVVSTMAYYDATDSERSIDAVVRNLEKLVSLQDYTFTAITDCRSYWNVIKFPEVKVPPKILPFASELELLEGMRHLADSVKQSKLNEIKRNVSIRSASSGVSMALKSLPNLLAPNVRASLFPPMFHPAGLLKDDELFKTTEVDLVCSTSDFLRGPTI
jgi:hypothetical protein